MDMVVDNVIRRGASIAVAKHSNSCIEPWGIDDACSRKT